MLGVEADIRCVNLGMTTRLVILPSGCVAQCRQTASQFPGGSVRSSIWLFIAFPFNIRAMGWTDLSRDAASTNY